LTFEHILNNVQVEFKIERVWTKNSKSGKDTLGVSVDNRSDAALTQIWDERIEDLLPLGISNLFLFDGEQVKELAEQETLTIDVTNAIKTLLGLELAERLATDIDILVYRKRKALADTKDLVSLEKIEQKLNLQKDKYEAAKEQLGIAQKEIETAQKHHDETSEKFLSEGGKIAKNRSQLETQLSYGNDAIANQRKDIVEVASDILPLALITPLLTQAQIQGQKESKHLEQSLLKMF
jgi:DNA sulfur modification protein DndD